MNKITNPMCWILILTLFSFISRAGDTTTDFCYDADVPEAQDLLMCLTAPTLFCPATYLGCPSADLDPAITGNPTALPGDASCPTPIVSYVDVVTTNTPCLKVIHRQWDATYPAGSASIKLHSSCQQTLYLEDNSPPVINNCPSDLVIDLSVSCDSTATWAVPTTSDDCGIQYFLTTHYSGSTFSSGFTPVTYTAKDYCGNESTCNFNVTVQGSCCSAPTITCPADMTLCPLIVVPGPNTTGFATAIASLPSCGTPQVTFSDNILSTGPCTHEEVIQRTWTATTGNESSTCVQIVTVQDNTIPTINNIPGNITVSGTGANCAVAVTWDQPTATDDCTVASLSSNYNSGTVFSEGVTTINYTATDNCGNQAISSFTVTVNCAVCNTPPSISCPATYTSCPANTPTPSVAGVAAASISGPNCSGTAAVTFVDVINSTGPCTGEINISRVWTAINPNDQSLSASCTQTITLSDNTAPTYSNVPGDITVSGDGNGCTVPVTWTAPTATDDCGIASSTSNFNSGTSFSEGTTTVTYTATDNCGKVTTAQFNVTVECAGCNTPPSITCPTNYSVCPDYPITPSEAGIPVIAPGSTNCDMPYMYYSDVVSNMGSCTNSAFVERTWVALDPATGLSSSCVQYISQNDNTPPTIVNVPQDVTLTGTGANCLATYNWPAIVAYDDCGSAAVSMNYTSGSSFAPGNTVVTCVATDGCGNTSFVSFTITVQCAVSCEVPPTIIYCPPSYSSCSTGIAPSPAASGYAISIIDGPNCSGIPYMTFSDNVISTGPCAGAQVIERIWTATDPNTKLQSTCTQMIYLGDSEPPTLANVPTNITVNGSGSNCTVPVNWTLPTTTDNCGAVTLTSTHTNGSNFPEGTTTVTYTATDGCGNSVTGSFTITVLCQGCATPPTLTCPSNYTACVSSPTGTNITGTAFATNSDPNCSSTPNVSYSDLVVSTGPCTGAIQLNRTWTAMDPISGLSTLCVQNITLTDSNSPVITNIPNNIVVDGTGSGCQVNVTWNQPIVTDECGAVTLSSTHSSGALFSEGTTTVTYTAVDGCNNATVASFTVTVNCAGCNTAPTLNCPTNYTACTATVVSPTVSPSISGTALASNNDPTCNAAISVSYSDQTISTGPCAGAVVLQRTWTAIDTETSLSNSCVQTITLEDNTAPVIIGMPNNITVSGDGSGCSVPVTWTLPTATDDCGTVSLNSNYTPNTSFYEGSTTVTYTATDNCGQSVSASFTVTVICAACTTPPVITCPANFTACYTSSTDPSVCGSAYASNNGSNCGIPNVSYTDVAISTGPCPGEIVTQRTWTATDPTSGLSTSCIQTITLVDDLPPTMSNIPQDITVTGSGPGCVESVTWQAITIQDNCGIPTLTSTHQSGDFFEEGSTEVSCIATDECNNTTTIYFTVTVLCEGCTTPPTIVCPADFTDCPSASTDPANCGYATATNTGLHCSGSPQITYADLIISTGPCNGAKVIQRTWTATDPVTGLFSTCVQMITLVDNDAPVITNLPSNIIVSGSGAGCSVLVSWVEPTITDNCTILSAGCSYVNGGLFPEGITTAVYTATDNCGNVSTGSFTITVTCAGCANPPILTCPQAFTTCPMTGIPDPTVSGLAYVISGGTHCGTPIVTFSDDVISTGPCTDAKEIERTWTAYDENNPALSVTCVQNISLEDTTPPTLASCPQDLILIGIPSTGSGTGSTTGCHAIATWNVPSTSDDCSRVTLIATDNNGQVVNPGDSFDDGITTVTYIATDLCGNSASCAFDVTVTCQDACAIPPSMTCPQNTIVCVGEDISPSIIGQPVVTGDPNCPSPTWSYGDNQISTGPCAGEAIYERTWTASYPGTTLSSDCTHTITIEDTDPVITGCPDDITVSSESTLVSWVTPTVSDLCGNAGISGSHVPGTTFSCGPTMVTYTATDNCGQTAECTFTVFVNCVAGGGFTYCPDDMVLTCTGGGAIANWNDPVYTNTCSDCSMGQNIPGFIYMGTYGGSQYYCSINPATWPSAKQNCETNGGYLAAINSAGENNFLANILTIQSAWIGLADLNNDNTFTWCNGENLGYTNWYPGQPNNFNNNQDYCEMLSNGQWNDQYNSYALEYIMEIPCNYVHQISGPTSGTLLAGGNYSIVYGVSDGCGTNETCSFNITVEETLTMECPSDIVITADAGATTAIATWNVPTANSCCSNCSGDIPGFMYMGSYGGHNYYCSLNPATWNDAKSFCLANGGDLASISSAGENSYLANILTLQAAWIGGNDLNSEGTFAWSNGDAFTYSNWYPGQPNNFNSAQHCLEMLSSGQWNDQYGSTMLEFIMELPGCININKTAGLNPGSSFPLGTTTISYEAADGCGNVQTCSFDVIVEAGSIVDCNGGGLNSSDNYIDICQFAAINNESGNNGGYADFTTYCEDIQPGEEVSIVLTPGYGPNGPQVTYWSCWIDFNQDGDFYDNDEFVAYGSGLNAISGEVSIPENIWNGECTLRVTAKLGGYATDPCSDYQFGETEDYCLTVYNGQVLIQGDQTLETRAAGNPATELKTAEVEIAAELVSLKVYPNPVSNNMNITIENPTAIRSLSLIDGSGRQVRMINDIQMKSSTDVTDLPAGVYSLSAQLRDGNMMSERVIIMH